MGWVDTRSIVDVQPEDLTGFTQCHFFAGIGGWSYALQLAGWPESKLVWTGSCPCQPFSVAGKQKGVEDERHLWPELWRLIAYCDPPVVFGEQVASKAGREWLSGVRDDLEVLGYAVGSADLCAAGAGAPHIRQRLYWVADNTRVGWRQRSSERRSSVSRSEQAEERIRPVYSGATGQLGDTDLARSQGRPIDAGEYTGECAAGEASTTGWLGESMHSERRSLNGPGQNEFDGHDAGWSQAHGELGASGQVRGMGESSGGEWGSRRIAEAGDGENATERSQYRDNTGASGSDVGICGFWSDFDIVGCTDDKARRIEPGSFPLAYGIPARMGRLRGYGNSIVPQVAAAFVEAFRDCTGCLNF